MKKSITTLALCLPDRLRRGSCQGAVPETGPSAEPSLKGAPQACRVRR
ncbi:MAG: hypothetical protein M0C28_44850 [Candidatus Moduliflexus flocculans]|nr:hypothetical protein [Candidatus Moduliflexus flocculans]